MHKWMTKTKGTSCERGYATFLHLSLSALRLRTRVPNVSSHTAADPPLFARMQIKRKQIKGFVVHGGDGFCVRFFATLLSFPPTSCSRLARSRASPLKRKRIDRSAIAVDIEPTHSLSQRLILFRRCSIRSCSPMIATWLLFVPLRCWLATSAVSQKRYT